MSARAANHLMAIGEAVDQLITVDMTGLWFSQGRNVLRELYEAARAKLDGPITLRIAERLQHVLGGGGTVIINTALTLPTGFAETDGPLGGAVLARAIQRALHARVVIVTDEGLESLVAATCQGAGLSVATLERLLELGSAMTLTGPPGDRHVVGVTGFPFDDAAAERRTLDLLDRLKPSAVIAIEKTGPNTRGVYHSMGGIDVSRSRSRAGIFFAEARRRSITTVGIGDGGNEIGMGTIRDTVERLVPFARRCQCPCGAGTADATIVDYCLPAMVSNVGAYGVAACLAAVTGELDAFHTAEVERRMTAASISAGAIDAICHYPEPSTDGLSVDVAVGIVEALRTTIRAIRLHEWDEYKKILEIFESQAGGEKH